MNNKKWIHAAKYVTYALLMLLLYVLQTTPGILEFFGVRPNLVVCAAVAVAMIEGEFIGGLYGALAGVFCDLGGFMLFGFHSILLLVAGVLIGLLFIYMLRPMLINFLLVLFVVMLTRGLLEYLLSYVMWGFAHVELIFWSQTLPTVIYTTAVGPLLYFLMLFINRKLEEKIVR